MADDCDHLKMKMSLQTGHMECLLCGAEFELIAPDQWVEVLTDA